MNDFPVITNREYVRVCHRSLNIWLTQWKKAANYRAQIRLLTFTRLKGELERSICGSDAPATNGAVSAACTFSTDRQLAIQAYRMVGKFAGATFKDNE